MNIIEILKEEHDNILVFLEQLHKKCLTFMTEDQIDIKGFRDDITFIRSYADVKHHQKEEKILFEVMTKHLGKTAVNLVQHGMLVEHDLARLHVMELEKAVDAYEKNPSAEEKLNILANAMGYYYLLHRHIDKENGAVYPFAEKNLSSEIMNEMNQRALDYDKEYQ